MGAAVVRLGIAGAAAGASIPPTFRAAGTILRAAAWVALVALLWAIALVAAGQTGWLTRLR
jgi:hypothetical protein